MNFLPNYNSQSLSSKNSLVINDIYQNKETQKLEEEKDYFDNLTTEQLKNLKIYKFEVNKNNSEEIEEKEKMDKSKFLPLKQIINTDFENEDFTELRKYLNQMTYQNYKARSVGLPNHKNEKLKLILSKYQELLEYLSGLEKKMIKFNNLLDQKAKKIFIPESENFSKEKELNIKIQKNEKKINSLLDKISLYKKIIAYANKIQNRPLVSFVLIIKDEENNFYCDICPDEIFPSYKDVQIHFFKKHKNILMLRKQNYELNNDIVDEKNKINEEEKKEYFDMKIKYMEEELNNYVKEINKNNEKNKDIKLENKKEDITNDKNIKENENDDTIKEKNFIEIEKKIKNLEDNQKRNQELLLDNFNKFKNEIFEKIRSIKNNQSFSLGLNTININNNNKIHHLNEIKNNIDIIQNNKIQNNHLDNNNQNNENENDKNFELGQSYQEDTILESVNTKIKNNTNNNIINNINNEPFFKPKLTNLNQLNNDKDNKINIKGKESDKEKIKKLNYEINPEAKQQPKVYNFVQKFYDRETNILFNQRGDELNNNYKILEENMDNSKIDLKKENEMIEELNNKYNLNNNSITKSGYNDIIKEIINKNENSNNPNHKAYFNNILSFLEIDKDSINNHIK